MEAAFEPIDANPSACVLAAAKQVCCSPESACDKAVRFAKHLPRHWANPALDELLGAAAGRGDPDSQVRSVLLEAHEEDEELLSHIGEDAWETRGRIYRAIEVLFAYRDDQGGSFACAYRLAALLARIFVRSGHDPREVDPEEIAAGPRRPLGRFARRLRGEEAREPPDRPSGGGCRHARCGRARLPRPCGGDAPAAPDRASAPAVRRVRAGPERPPDDRHQDRDRKTRGRRRRDGRRRSIPRSVARP